MPNNKEKLVAHIEELMFEKANHISGNKKVFLKKSDTSSNLTQFAYGIFTSGTKCEKHSHLTMEECFYFLSGEGIFIIEGTNEEVRSGSFVRVPVGKEHQIICSGTEDLEFIYFGIAV